MFSCKKPTKKQKSARSLALPYNVKKIQKCMPIKKSVAAGAPW
jgi:hypothetical protein